MHVHAAPAGPGAKRTTRVLQFSLAATFAYVVVTFVAGLRAHFLALLLSFVAIYFQSRPADQARTFGYQRTGVLAAFINAATLVLISLWIFVEAIHRFSNPVSVQ